MDFIDNPSVSAVVEKYPQPAREKLEHLRSLVIQAAEETPEVNRLEETLKWGEPSYLTKTGTTIRMDWKKANPDQYAFYFTCTTSLVGTFKMIYGDLFQYEGNRALVFNMDDSLPDEEIKQCLKLALTYHKVKHLPLLGL